MITMSESIKDTLQHIEDVYAVFRKKNITFSKTEAIKIVGSRSVLERLEATGKIRVEKYNETYRKGQWKCNGEDILRHASDV